MASADPRNLEAQRIELTPAQAKVRRQRNVAIGLLIAFLCILFYAVTLAKMGVSFGTKS